MTASNSTPSRMSKSQSHYGRIEQYQKPEEKNATNRSSLYSSFKQLETPENDTEYIAQISKSLGRLGYGKDSDGKLARPPAQFNDQEMVPPPPLFSSAPVDRGELYGVMAEKSTQVCQRTKTTLRISQTKSFILDLILIL